MKYFLLIATVLNLALAGCSRRMDHKEASYSPVSDVSVASVAQSKSEDMGAAENDRDALGVSAGAPAIPVAQVKEIVKTANLVLEVKSNADYANYLKAVLAKQGAYISKEDHNATDNKEHTTLVIKVPVAKFDSLVGGLVTKDVKQLQKNIALEDITAAVIDTRARLETRKATRDKYLEFLKQAGKVEDVLKIQHEINNIQEEIESAEARLADLSGQARYSTVNLTYFEPQSGYDYYDANPGFWKRIGKAFTNGGRIFGDLFIGLITAWPFWITGLVIFFVLKKYKRKKQGSMKL